MRPDMSPMIGGTDVVFGVPRGGCPVRTIVDAVAAEWPAAHFLDGEGDAPMPVVAAAEAGLLDDKGHGEQGNACVRREFFLYKDAASADVWGREGRTDRHAEDQLHVLLRDRSDDCVEVTLVVGSPTPGTSKLVAAVKSALDLSADSCGEPVEPPSRMAWDSALNRIGFPGGRLDFYDLVVRRFHALFPKWSIDELVCNPDQARLFCSRVRRLVPGATDNMVLKALMNSRRLSNGSGDADDPTAAA